MTKIMFIYALIDPRNDSLFYIGQSKNPDVRLLNHIHKSHLGKTPKDTILTELIKDGKVPQIKILEEIPVDTTNKQSIFFVAERERAWINEIISNGILNIQKNSTGEINASCLYCEKPFHKKHKRGTFCSPKCKVYWHRENKAAKPKTFEQKIADLTKPKTSELKPPPQTNFTINTADKIKELEEEFNRTPDIGLGKKLRATIQKRIYNLKWGITT